VTVVTLGETMIRLSPSRGERLIDAERLELTVGGAESNVAVALAALGIPARWVGALPRNGLGERVASALSAAGVDVSQIVWRAEGRLGLYFLEIAVPPRPARVVYDRGDSAMTAMTADDLGVNVFAGMSYAVVSGITAALKPHGAELARVFLARAGEHGCRRVVDVNQRTQLWSAAEAAATLSSLAREADMFFCSEADARSVFGLEVPETDLPSALRRIATGATLIAVTLGPRGAIAWEERAGSLEAMGLEVEVVDAIGAGDALVAGLIWGELAGLRPAEALQAGAALSALACTVRGDHARFDRATLEAVLRRTSGKALR
jgi:2-dehydro-3-deoxygluconokinase